MDPDTALKLFTQFGVSGLIGYLLWLAIKDRFSDMKERVTKLESKVDDCEKDREALWERLSKHDK